MKQLSSQRFLKNYQKNLFCYRCLNRCSLIRLCSCCLLKLIKSSIIIEFAAASFEESVNLICKNLQEDLKKRFALILSDDGDIKVYGDLQIYDNYKKLIEQLLKNKHRFFIRKGLKVLHFYPLKISNSLSGLILAEVTFYDDFILNFRRILPSITDQVSLILESFLTRFRINEMKINEEREKLRSLILLSISHDLKTPLSSIIGGLTICNDLSNKNKLSKDDRHTLVSIALDEAKRLSCFISDVLEMIKIKSGAITLQKQFFNPFIVIDRIIHRLQLKLRGYQVVLSLSYEVEIFFDPISFEQIIQNLLDNSVKYSFRNTKIMIYEEFDEEGSYKIFIQDEGNGIDPKKLDSIFDEFERFTDKSTGNGLGLSIVKALMEVNNAKISVKNVEGKGGITFTLQFHEFQIIS